MKSTITKNRITQVREILTSTKQEDLDSVISSIKDSSKAIILAIQEQNQTKNRTIKKQLKSFVNSYIAWLSENELFELISNINYFEHKFDKISSNLVEHYEPIELVDKHPLNTRIERLLLNWTLLPVEKLKKDFNSEMQKILERLYIHVENDAKKAWLLIEPVNADFLLHVMKQKDDDSHAILVWKEINGYMKSISFSSALEELHAIEVHDSDKEWISNHIMYQLEFIRDWKFWVTKEELISFLDSLWYKKSWENYALGWNNYIQINAQFFNKQLNTDEDGETKEKVIIEVYSEAKKSSMTSEQYLELSLPFVTKVTQDLVNDIYNKFWNPKQKFIFSIDNLVNDIYYSEDEDEEWFAIVWWKENWNNNIYNSNINKKSKLNTGDIILEDAEMQELEMLMQQFKNEKHFKDHWAEIAKWTAVYWPPGTWKTLFARILSKEIDADFIVIKISEILNKYEWWSEKNIQRKINQAKNIAKKGQKVIIFFDEADILFESRWNERNNKEGIVSILLQELDWIHENELENIFIFFATNRLEKIDWALLERLDKKIKIWLPNDLKRIEHFKLNISGKTKKVKNSQFWDINYNILSKETSWKSGRFIKKLINNAVTKFAHNRLKNSKSKLITTQDILNGLKLAELEEKNSIWFNSKIK